MHEPSLPDRLAELRRVAAMTLDLCDLTIFGTPGDARAALRKLPDVLGSLRFLAQRVMTTLEERSDDPHGR
jgi:hypothetical protein